MKHTLALVLMVFGIVGCSSTMNPSSPRAQALMQEIRAERLAAERIERAELTANRKNTPEKEEDINELISRINKTTLETRAIQEKTKQKILAGLKLRCEEYGFTGDGNISACIQREAQHDKELAMQKYELQKTRLALQQAQSQAQSRAYAQSLPPVVEEEEDLPFLIKFLGDVAIGVAEQYPAAVLEAQQKQDAYNRGVKQGRAQAKPNCGGPNCY